MNSAIILILVIPVGIVIILALAVRHLTPLDANEPPDDE